ncbi:hypothetical protein AB4084_38740, partial [Lysobacter sp. 2RAB21]
RRLLSTRKVHVRFRGYLPIAPESPMSASKATAANRFGLGARPGEIDRGSDGREVLLAQLQLSLIHIRRCRR